MEDKAILTRAAKLLRREDAEADYLLEKLLDSEHAAEFRRRAAGHVIRQAIHELYNAEIKALADKLEARGLLWSGKNPDGKFSLTRVFEICETEDTPIVDIPFEEIVDRLEAVEVEEDLLAGVAKK